MNHIKHHTLANLQSHFISIGSHQRNTDQIRVLWVNGNKKGNITERIIPRANFLIEL